MLKNVENGLRSSLNTNDKLYMHMTKFDLSDTGHVMNVIISV